MSGPIVRTGTTPKFWENWDKVFGDKTEKKSGKGKSDSGKAAAGRTTARKAATAKKAAGGGKATTTGAARGRNKKK